MIFDEKDRLAKIYISPNRLRNISSEETIKAMMSMNKAMVDICVASIKSENPDITEKELIKEMNKIFWCRS